MPTPLWPRWIPSWRQVFIGRTKKRVWYTLVTLGLFEVAGIFTADQAGWLTLLFWALAIAALGAAILGGVLRVLAQGERIHRMWGSGWLPATAGWIGVTLTIWIYLAGLGFNQGVLFSGSLVPLGWTPGWIGAVIMVGLAVSAFSLALADVLRFTQDETRRAQELDRRGRTFGPMATASALPPEHATDQAGERAGAPIAHKVTSLAAAPQEPVLELPLTQPMRVALEAATHDARTKLFVSALLAGVALAFAVALRSGSIGSLAIVALLAGVAYGWIQVRRILELREDLRFGTYVQEVGVRGPMVGREPRGVSPSEDTSLRLLRGGELAINQEIATTMASYPYPMILYAWSSQFILEIRASEIVVLYRGVAYARALAQA